LNACDATVPVDRVARDRADGQVPMAEEQGVVGGPQEGGTGRQLEAETAYVWRPVPIAPASPHLPRRRTETGAVA
jgi:hypothetical protein